MEEEYERQQRCIHDVYQKLIQESGMSEPVFLIIVSVVIFSIINYFLV